MRREPRGYTERCNHPNEEGDMMSASLVQAHSQPKLSSESISPSASRLRVLRLSVTSLCNFRCRYCMPKEGVPKVAHSDLLPLEGLVTLVEWLSSRTKISRVRITGGEPLVRPGIEHLIAELSCRCAVIECVATGEHKAFQRFPGGATAQKWQIGHDCARRGRG